MQNFGYTFYRDCFSGYKNGKIEESLEDCNKKLLSSHSDWNEEIVKKFILNYCVQDGVRYFGLETIYPGLLIGSGYHHEVGEKEEFKIGFYFDYTTGLPVIPGSSIKGALRSVFPNNKDEDEKKEYIKEKLNEICVKDNIDIEKLKLEIFEGIKDGKLLPISKRDIFFDAFPIKKNGSKFLSDDYITPHKDPLKNPIPLKFLKVSSGVVFCFFFKLNNGEIRADEKLRLFKSIILDIGLGAKTNVGYGRFKKTGCPRFIRNDFEDLIERIVNINTNDIKSILEKKSEDFEKLDDSKKKEIVRLIKKIFTDEKFYIKAKEDKKSIFFNIAISISKNEYDLVSSYFNESDKKVILNFTEKHGEEKHRKKVNEIKMKAEDTELTSLNDSELKLYRRLENEKNEDIIDEVLKFLENEKDNQKICVFLKPLKRVINNPSKSLKKHESRLKNFKKRTNKIEKKVKCM